MSLDTLGIAFAGWKATRRHRRNTERGMRHHDDAILRWPLHLRATPVAKELATTTPAVNGVNEGSAL